MTRMTEQPVLHREMNFQVLDLEQSVQSNAMTEHEAPQERNLYCFKSQNDQAIGQGFLPVRQRQLSTSRATGAGNLATTRRRKVSTALGYVHGGLSRVAARAGFGIEHGRCCPEVG